MKKIYCNKILVYTFVIMFFMIFDMIYFAFCNQSEHILFLSIINILLNLILIPVISFLFIRKVSRIIIISDSSFEFVNKLDGFKIPLEKIEYLSYMKSVNGFYDLSINLISGSSKSINLTKGVIKKIARLSKKRLLYLKNNGIVTLKESFTNWLNELKENIIEHRYRIICALVGVIISAIAILLKNYFNNIALIIISCVVCFIYAVIQLVVLYVNEFSIKFRIFTSIFVIIVLAAIFFGISCLLFKNVFELLDIFIYTIYILPSFVVVIILIILTMAALSYA